ncbi:MAG: AbrB/MazE/SpoVT family DNA-binding domain-containing protein [Janthinobacterium lividum]
MLIDIIKIGNSKGLRIPKSLLEQCQITNTINLIVEDHKLVIIPSKHERTGWGKQFRLMAERDDYQLLDLDTTASSWDQEEWQW